MLYIDLYVQLRAMSLYDYLFIVTFCYTVFNWGLGRGGGGGGYF